jgi:hypothetical protein
MRIKVRTFRFFNPGLGFLKAMPIVAATLLATIALPVHASTPGFDTLVNYDTAWTYVYDGGMRKDNSVIWDNFIDA